MQINLLPNVRFGSGQSIYLNGFRNGYINGVDGESYKNSENNYQTTWERTLYEAAYDKGLEQGQSEQGKGVWDLKFRSIYDYDTEGYNCREIYNEPGAGIYYDCAQCNRPVTDCPSMRTPDNIPEETLELSQKTGMSLPDAQDYLDITKNDTL